MTQDADVAAPVEVLAEPAMQSVQVVVPVLEEYFPLLQGLHVDNVPSENFPAEQLVHALEPAFAYLPEAHGKHASEVEPVAVRNFPTAQRSH